MKVLIDLNVILDVILKRTPWVANSQAVWDAHTAGAIDGHLIATSLTNLFYIVRRQLSAPDALKAVNVCLRTFAILAVDAPILNQAAAMPGADFEDNVQIAAAAHFTLDKIVTRNPADFAGSPIPAISPADLLTQITPPVP